MAMVRSDGKNRSLLLYVVVIFVVVYFVNIVELEAQPVIGALEGSEFALETWGDSCASLTEAGCFACTSSSYFCHWCGKLNSCHALVSPYGCLSGTSCYTPSECMRKEPEFLGYFIRTWKMVLIIAGVVMLLLMFGGFAIFIARRYTKEPKTEKAAVLYLREMEGEEPVLVYSDDDSVLSPSDVCVTHEIQGNGYEIVEHSMDEHGLEFQPEYIDDDDPSIDYTTNNNLIESISSTQPSNEALTTPLICSDDMFPKDSTHLLAMNGKVAAVDQKNTTQHSTPRQHNRRWLLWRVPMEQVTKNGKGCGLRLISYANTLTHWLYLVNIFSYSSKMCHSEGILLYEHSCEFLTLFSRTPEPSLPLLPSLVYSSMKICCGLLMAAALVGGCLLAFYAPHKPVFNICDTSFDWRSIVHSIEALQVITDFEMLVSVYNPNRFNIRVERGIVLFKNSHQEVGQIIMNDNEYDGGKVTDVLFTMSFDTKVWEELRLGYKYEMGQLSFLVESQMDASVLVFRRYYWKLPLTSEESYISTVDFAHNDVNLCNCHDMT